MRRALNPNATDVRSARRSHSMGIVIGSCMAKETSATSLNSPAAPSLVRRINNNENDEEREPRQAVEFRVHSANAANEQRIQRILSGQHGYIHARSQSRHSVRPVINGEPGSEDCQCRGGGMCWHRVLAADTPFFSFGWVVEARKTLD